MLKYQDIEKAKKKLEEEIAAKKSFDEELNKIKSDYDISKFNFITCRQRADDLKKQIESFVIIENIALSKYLNSLQIYEYVILRGFNITRVNLRKKINNLIRHRIIQENELLLRGAEHGI